jgi:hypothetical protein
MSKQKANSCERDDDGIAKLSYLEARRKRRRKHGSTPRGVPTLPKGVFGIDGIPHGRRRDRRNKRSGARAIGGGPSLWYLTKP